MIYMVPPSKEEFENYGTENLLYVSKINNTSEFVRLNNAFGDLIKTSNSFDLAKVRADWEEFDIVWAH